MKITGAVSDSHILSELPEQISVLPNLCIAKFCAFMHIPEKCCVLAHVSIRAGTFCDNMGQLL